MNFLIQLVIAVAMLFLSAFLTPRTKAPKPEITDLENPTAEAGRDLPVIFGTVTTSSPNVLWFGEKRTTTYEIGT